MIKKAITKPKRDLNKNLFDPLQLFMVRSSILPVDFFEYLFSSHRDRAYIVNQLKTLAQDKDIQEIIYVSSESLYHSLRNWDKVTDPKKDEQILHSFCKYLIRMSTRPTPFGLVSGVSYGLFHDDESQMNLDSYEYHMKRARPDMAWLLSIVQKLEQDPSILKQLKAKRNNIIFQAGNRLNLPYKSNCGQQEISTSFNMETISIRNTKVTDIILDLTKDYIKVSEIITTLQREFPDVEMEKIESVIMQLVENEYLITELRPPLTMTEPFEYVLEKIFHLQGIESLQTQLQEIHQLLITYNQLEIGEGLQLLQNIVNRMKQVSNKKHPLQVDVRLSNPEIKLNESVKDELRKVAEVLWKISPEQTGMPHLNDYREDFIEKYGTYREVPLLELLDEDHGLGAPATYRFPKSRRTLPHTDDLHQKKQEQFLLNKLLEAYKTDSYTINLDDRDIEQLSHDVDIEHAPASLELYGSIIANSKEDVDCGQFTFTLGFNPGSNGAGKTFGRFIDLFPEEKFTDEYEKIYEREAENEDVIFAELVYLPSAGKLANVAISENKRNYEVVIGTNAVKSDKHTIPVSDLYIGATLEHFYIKSKSLGKRVMLTTNHMLNIQTAPNIYRFLIEVSSDGILEWSPLLWYNLETAPFLPRVEYSKSVLSLAKWNISKRHLNLTKNSFTAFQTAFEQFRDKWNMPRYVYQTQADNRVLLDLFNPIHLEVLYKDLSKLKEDELITLVEKEMNVLDSWVKDHLSQSYHVEFVFPFINEKALVKKQLPLRNNEPLQTNSNLVTKFPGEEWLFIKLYGNASREEELISYHMKHFCEYLLAANVVEQYFFMRYADPKQHIRLRFKGIPEKLNASLLPALNNWLQQLQADGLIQQADISTYEREVERYGGPQLIDLAEKLFFADSEVVSDLLHLTRIQGTDLTQDQIAVISVIHYLGSFGLPFKEQLAWFNSMTSYKDYLKEFRNDRKIFMEIGNDDHDWAKLKECYEDGNYMIDVLNKRKQIVETYIDKLHDVYENGELYNEVEDILGSILHLHLNRLIGIDRERENKIMTLVRHTLHNLRYLKEGMK